jgi:biopolymer transport protein ExbD
MNRANSVLLTQAFPFAALGLSLTLAVFMFGGGSGCPATHALLPVTQQAQILPSTAIEPLIITIELDRNVFVGAKWARSSDHLVRAVKHRVPRDQPVVVHADARLAYGEVRRTLRDLRSAQVTSIVLSAEREQHVVPSILQYLVER